MCVSMCMLDTQRSGKGIRCLQLELEMVVSHRVWAGILHQTFLEVTVTRLASTSWFCLGLLSTTTSFLIFLRWPVYLVYSCTCKLYKVSCFGSILYMYFCGGWKITLVVVLKTAYHLLWDTVFHWPGAYKLGYTGWPVPGMPPQSWEYRSHKHFTDSHPLSPQIIYISQQSSQAGTVAHVLVPALLRLRQNCCEFKARVQR